MEEYKLFKSIKRNSGLEIRYLLSNKGNIKLEAYIKGIFVDEEYLSIGNCVYCGDNNELGVYHSGLHYIYREVYKLFKGDIHKGYQIHHIDFNHFNNNINNLECISPHSHGLRHRDVFKCINTGYVPTKEHTYYNDYIKYLDAIKIKDHIKSIEYTIDDSKRDLFKLYERFEQSSKSIREQLKEKAHNDVIEHNKQKRLDYVNKQLKTGDYYLNNDGKLVKKNKRKWDDEKRDRIKALRKHVYEDPEWHRKVSEGVKKYKESL